MGNGYKQGVSSRLKGSMFSLARNFGLLKLARRLNKYQHSVLILCYHGISKSDEHMWRPALYMDSGLFRQRLKTIHDLGCQVLPLPEALDRIRRGALDAPTVSLTFDDGWHDFYSVAWPILKEFGYPSTVYQTTFYSTYNRPVFDTACSYILWKARGRTLSSSEFLGNASSSPICLDSADAIDRATRIVQRQARKLNYSAERKDAFLADLANELDLDYADLLRSRTLHLMNAEELGEIAASGGVEIQLHTHRHQLPLEKKLFIREIDENRSLIEFATHKPAKHFCYPNGEYRPEFERWLRDAGVASAATTDPGFVSMRSESLLLPRIADSECISQARFESWLSGIGLLGFSSKRAVSHRCLSEVGECGHAPVQGCSCTPDLCASHEEY